MNKREVFTWKKEHNILLVREILVEEPHQFKPSTKERGKVWKVIQNNLTKAGLKVTKRSVRERFEKLYKEFKQREYEELKASGICAEYDEVHKALTDIHEKVKDYEDEQNEKDTKEKAQAEEMRKKATEKLSETKKRKSIEKDDEDVETPRRKRAGNVVEIMEKQIERKGKECEEQRQIKERELELKSEEIRQQQQFNGMIFQHLQQQQQQQQQQLQQQQAMNMAFMNTLAEIMKKFN